MPVLAPGANTGHDGRLRRVTATTRASRPSASARPGSLPLLVQSWDPGVS